MMYALSWFFVLALLALWSLAAWALHGMAVWAVSNAGALGVGVGGGAVADAMQLPDWLAPWVPPELAQWAGQALAALGPVVEGLLQAAPALAGGVTVLTWIAWGIGSVLLLLLGAGMHLAISLLRRRQGGGSVTTAARALAGG